MLPAERTDVTFGNVKGYEQQAEGAGPKERAESMLLSVRSEELVFPDVKVPEGEMDSQTTRLQMLGIAGSAIGSGRCEAGS